MCCKDDLPGSKSSDEWRFNYAFCILQGDHLYYTQEFCPLISEPEHILLLLALVVNVLPFRFCRLIEQSWVIWSRRRIRSHLLSVSICWFSFHDSILFCLDDAFICYSISPTFAFLLPSLIRNRNCAHTTFAALGDNLLLFIQLYF